MHHFNIVQTSCNGTLQPIGLDEQPLFSWKMQSSQTGDVQTSYRLTIATSVSTLAQGKALTWDSGEVQSCENAHIPLPAYVVLPPRTRFYWQVVARNSTGQLAQSPCSFFETGKLTEPWQARWIMAAHTKNDATSHGAPLLRKAIALSGKVASARLYLCGVGFYEATINGQRISNAVMEPAYTKYDTTLYYKAYDVTELFTNNNTKQGAIGITLGNSWYNYFEQDEWNTKYASWHAVPRCIAELHILYSDGTSQIICTDASWKSAPGPITYNNMRNGESYDARLAQKGWNTVGFDDSAWQSAIVARSPGGVMKTTQMPAVEVMQTIAPTSFWQNENGGWVFDFGQNMAGNALLCTGGTANTEITLQYSEVLSPDQQHIDNSKLRQFTKSGDFQTERYIKATDAQEIWCSQFSYHGFRYVEVDGLTDTPTANTLIAQVMHTAFSCAGTLTCANEAITTISTMCHWASISNFFGMPTDSPHREKNAWTGDAAVVSEQFLLNYDAAPSLLKWMDDVCDAQRPNGCIPCVVPSTGWGYNSLNGPDWSKALTEIPWNIYLYTGNKAVLAKYYPYMKKHCDFMETLSDHDIICCGIGDWCAPFEGAAISANMSAYKAPLALTDTACYYYAADILARIENILGYAPVSRSKAQRIRAVWRTQFLNPGTLQIAGDCQTSYACALYNGLLEENETHTVLQHLIRTFVENNYHVDFGLIGLRYVFNALGQHGRADIIYQCLQCDTYPSYLHWHRMGLTALGECWNGLGSQNHCMMSDVSASLYKHIAGIRTEETAAGFRKFTLAPSQMDKIPTFCCEHETPHGKVAVRWETVNNIVQLQLEIPFGTSAQLILPPAFASSTALGASLGSGQHSFSLHKTI